MPLFTGSQRHYGRGVVSAPSGQPARFCRGCGAPLTDRATFCSKCGTAVGAPPPPAPVYLVPAAPTSHTARNAAVAVVVLLLLLGLVAAATIPVNQTQTTSATITDPGSTTTTYTDDVAMSHAGLFDFSWESTSGGSVTFTVSTANGATLFSQSAASGSGAILVNSGDVYVFGVYAWLPETVQFSGSLHYSAPFL